VVLNVVISCPYQRLKTVARKPWHVMTFEGLLLVLFCLKYLNIVCSSNCNRLLSRRITSLDSRKAGCSHPIYTGRTILDRWVSQGFTANLCAIDLLKVFDKVNYHAISMKLMRRNIPVEIIKIVENLPCLYQMGKLLVY